MGEVTTANLSISFSQLDAGQVAVGIVYVCIGDRAFVSLLSFNGCDCVRRAACVAVVRLQPGWLGGGITLDWYIGPGLLVLIRGRSKMGFTDPKEYRRLKTSFWFL